MKRLAAIATVAIIMAWCGAAEAKNKTSSKSHSKTAESNTVNKKTDPNAAQTAGAKQPAQMSEQEIKAAQQQIEKAKQENIARHEEYMKELYSLRALAIKERASETENAVDEIIAKEKGRFGDAADVKEPNSGKTKAAEKHKKK